MKIIRLTIISAIVLLAILSCNQDSGVVTKYKGDQSQEELLDSEENDQSNDKKSFSNQVHTVIVDEVLPATKYVYVHVSEGVEKYWVATALKEITVGETYFFRGGLLKTNFESKEYNRMFEKIYLVSQFVPAKHGGSPTNATDPTTPSGNQNNEATVKSVKKVEKAAGSISIAELVNDPQKYEGQSVQLSGECVKINPKIMGKNWIHLKDGSKDDYDLVITSDIFVREGSIITIKATVVLNKDYGAGYNYSLILEDGILVE